MKKTPWFPLATNPVRIGIYQIDWSDGDKTVFYSYWDGEKFNGAWLRIRMAMLNRDSGVCAFGIPVRWRGIVQAKKEAE